MAEPRRVQLTTLSSDLPASSDKQPPPHKSPSRDFQVKENCSDPPSETDTVRLVLGLFEPDERSFPEFSYSRLIDNEVGIYLDVCREIFLISCIYTTLNDGYCWTFPPINIKKKALSEIFQILCLLVGSLFQRHVKL